MTAIGIPLPAGRRLDVVGVGQNAVDHLCTVRGLPRFDSKQAMVGYACAPGGQVATALVALARWGCRTAYVGSFGDDDMGRLSRRSLVDEGIDVGGARVCPGVANQMAVILVDEASGERTILVHRPPGLTLGPDDLDRDRVTAGRVLHLDGCDPDAARAAAGWARAAGTAVVVDLDMRSGAVEELLRLTDAVIVSRDLARELTGAEDPGIAVERLATLSRAPLTAITLGAAGAIVRSQAGRLHAPAFPVACVDTTGAGDVFHAGFIYGMLRSWSLERTVRFANAAAALKCTRVGGRAGVPTVAEAEALAGRSV